ncbi:MAG: heparinase II/III family protein [Halieaceae bacterium]|nr:heparinase II/III family protein [Halieaceae bacterium]
MKLPQGLLCALLCLLAAWVANAQGSSHPRLLLTAAEVRENADSWRQSEYFSALLKRTQERVDSYFQTAPEVPWPKDAGGGYTHEQHKRNAAAVWDAGLLYLWTGEPEYSNHVRGLLLAYSDLYPSLPEHPQKKEQAPGRLFWQSLNEAVWLVNSILGYDAVYESLSTADRSRIESRLFRNMVEFLSVESPQTFDRIHNHGAWAAAAVGMTGYVLNDSGYVNRALLGLKQDGSAGFLKQLDELLSPGGYYQEGPYYQRYALMPLVLFAKAIEQNEPERRIFDYRGGVLRKAIHTTLQLSYNGKFFPINDAIKDKGLDTFELDYAIPIAWGLTLEPSLLSLLEGRGTLALTGDGLRMARAWEAGLGAPFAYASIQLRDGPEGGGGALSIMRSGSHPGHAALVFKATSQGMGHGHFDRLNWLYYDNGREIISDYGAARFLNIVQKNGGHYLPENNSWAKQTVAHNTLVVDHNSHFGGVLQAAEEAAPDTHFFHLGEQTQIASAREANAYPGVEFTRTVMLLKSQAFPAPLVVDILKVRGNTAHQYDLPLYYQGQVIESTPPLVAASTTLKRVGNSNGYQHLWLRARNTIERGVKYSHTWLAGNRFYTWSQIANARLSVLMTETGASDPEFNLRHEPGLLFRVEDANRVTFVGALETHGEYNGAREFTTGSGSRIAAIRRFGAGDKDLIQIETITGERLCLAFSYDADTSKTHAISLPDGNFAWAGFHRRFSC